MKDWCWLFGPIAIAICGIAFSLAYISGEENKAAAISAQAGCDVRITSSTTEITCPKDIQQ